MVTATAPRNKLDDVLNDDSVSTDHLDPQRELTDEEQDYLFDLRGYRIIRRALSPSQLKEINDWVDAHPVDKVSRSGSGSDGRIGEDQWIGNVEMHSYGGEDGVNYQNIVEGGRIFEEMIDNPAWIDQIRRYIPDSYSMAAKIDECFLNVRGQGGYIGLHSGGNNSTRFTGVFHRLPTTGAWCVGQINIIMALTDVGPGDGPTVIVPGSHKSLMRHPEMLRKERDHAAGKDGRMNDRPASEAVGAVEMHLKAGDALMFTDAVCHGSAARTNPGKRRVMIYRYAPALLASRYHYLPSEELLERLTPERRRIIEPIPARMRPGRTLRYESLPPFVG